MMINSPNKITPATPFPDNQMTTTVNSPLNLYLQSSSGIVAQMIINYADLSAVIHGSIYYNRDEEETTTFFAKRHGCLATEKINTKNIDIGYAITHMNAVGTTALHIAVMMDEPAIVKSLILDGADLSALDDNGDTAMHCCASNGSLEMLHLLLHYQHADIDLAGDAAIGQASL